MRHTFQRGGPIQYPSPRLLIILKIEAILHQGSGTCPPWDGQRDCQVKMPRGNLMQAPGEKPAISTAKQGYNMGRHTESEGFAPGRIYDHRCTERDQRP